VGNSMFSDFGFGRWTPIYKFGIDDGLPALDRAPKVRSTCMPMKVQRIEWAMNSSHGEQGRRRRMQVTAVHANTQATSEARHRATAPRPGLGHRQLQQPVSCLRVGRRSPPKTADPDSLANCRGVHHLDSSVWREDTSDPRGTPRSPSTRRTHITNHQRCRCRTGARGQSAERGRPSRCSKRQPVEDPHAAPARASADEAMPAKDLQELAGLYAPALRDAAKLGWEKPGATGAAQRSAAADLLDDFRKQMAFVDPCRGWRAWSDPDRRGRQRQQVRQRGFLASLSPGVSLLRRVPVAGSAAAVHPDRMDRQCSCSGPEQGWRYAQRTWVASSWTS